MPDIDQVKDLFKFKTEKELVNRAIKEYNKLLARFRERVPAYDDAFATIVQSLTKRVERARTQPADSDILFIPILEKIVHKVVKEKLELTKALEDIPEIKRSSPEKSPLNYLPTDLIYIRRKENIVPVINNLTPYQIAIMGNEFEIPRPFSQNLIKQPEIERDQGITMYIYFLAEKELVAKHGNEYKAETGRILTLTAAMHQSGTLRREAEKLLKSKEFYQRAVHVTDSLPEFEALKILYGSTLNRFIDNRQIKTTSKRVKEYIKKVRNPFTRKVFQELRITPDMLFRIAYEMNQESSKEPLTFAYWDFDRKNLRVGLHRNNHKGLLMHLFSDISQNLKDQGLDVDIANITKISKNYGDNFEGTVTSISRKKRDNHDVELLRLPLFKGFNEQIFSAWSGMQGNCSCDDLKYTAKMHKKLKQPLVYFCANLINFALACYEDAINTGYNVMNPFPFYKRRQAEFMHKAKNQVLVERKEDGKFKSPNRAELEWWGNLNVQNKGYSKTLTTNIQEAIRVAEQIDLMDIVF